MKPMIQIAGINSFKEAQMLINCGVEYLGFPLRLNIHTPDLSEEDASKIIRSLNKKCKSVLITYLNKAHDILDFMKYLGTDYVQLHGPIKAEELKKVKKAKKEIFIIKSLVVGRNNKNDLLQDVKKFESYVDAFITDTFDPTTGASGATGKTHDWSVSKKLVEISSKPVILAGGINPTNVRKAIEVVKPAGVDSHTGVENNQGEKDQVLVKKFMEEANLAFKDIID